MGLLSQLSIIHRIENVLQRYSRTAGRHVNNDKGEKTNAPSKIVKYKEAKHYVTLTGIKIQPPLLFRNTY